MTYKPIRILTFIFGAGLLSGCVSLAGNPEFSDVGRQVHHRMGVKIEKLNKKSAQEIGPLLEEKLTVDKAVQIALTNNGRLRAEFEALGITKADLVQATLGSAFTTLMAPALRRHQSPRHGLHQYSPGRQ